MRIRNLIWNLFILVTPLQAETFDIHTYFPLTQAMDEFNHKLAGCNKEAIHIEECNPRAGIFDAKLWRKIQKLAAKAGLCDNPQELVGAGPDPAPENTVPKDDTPIR